ncbi:MAG: FHA domain-containing protein [Pseudomonadota bacterium]
MSIKRGPDGRILETPTVGVPPTGKNGRTGSPSTPTPPSNTPSSAAGKYDTPTVKPSGNKPPTGGRPAAPSTPDAPKSARPKLEEATRIVGREDQTQAGTKTDNMDDPVVGWLVIVEGPGKGAVLTIGYGRNTLGRGNDNRMVCDFGDGEVSRKPHCIVTYEPRGRMFLLQHGDGVNLTYLSGETVLEPRELQSGSIIEVGSTHLKFVPFCSKDWDWQDSQTAAAPDA